MGLHPHSRPRFYHIHKGAMMATLAKDVLDTMRRLSRPGIEFVSVADELRKFRLKLETEADGVPLHLLEVNACDLLSDLIAHLQLGQAQHDAILGANNVRYLEAVNSQRVRPAARGDLATAAQG